MRFIKHVKSSLLKSLLTKFGIRLSEWHPYLWDISQTERIVEYGWTLQNIEGQRILDIGSWGTLFPIQLASLGYTVVGIDLRDVPYSHPNFKFIRGNIFDPNIQKEIIRSGKFDTILLISTLEHVGILLQHTPDLMADIKLLRLLKQVLKKGGVILVTVPIGKPKILKRRKGRNENFPGEWVPWLKVYNLEQINKFQEYYNIEKIDIFEEKKGYWVPTTLKNVENIDYPEYGAKIKSIACIKLRFRD